MPNKNNSVRSTPFIKGPLKRLPENLEIDFRHSICLSKWRYYFELIAGRELRKSRLTDRRFIKASESIFLTMLIIFMALFGLLLAYLIKSALGIDLFPGFSLGIWSWFKETFYS